MSKLWMIHVPPGDVMANTAMEGVEGQLTWALGTNWEDQTRVNSRKDAGNSQTAEGA